MTTTYTTEGTANTKKDTGRSRSPVDPDDLDWQMDRSVLECNKYMLDTQTQCDITFQLVAEDNGGSDHVCLSAHSYILISRSPVFFAMFAGPLAESMGKDNQVKVTDISLECFKIMLSYLYTEEVELTDDNVFGVLYAAKKYMVGGLVKQCVSFLHSILRPGNVCIYLDNAFLLEDQRDLLSQCTDLIQRQSQLVFHSEAFYQMTRDSLCRVLAMSRLSMPEIDVFRACEHWAKRQCEYQQLAHTTENMRKLLGKALYLLHLPALDLDQYSSIVVPSGLLSTQEENAVFRYLLSHNKNTKDGCSSSENLPFPTHTRSFVAGRAMLQYNHGFIRHTTSFTSLFQGLPQRSRWSMTFQCDHNLKLTEIGLLGSFRGTITVAQGGQRKLEVTYHAHTQHIKLQDKAPLLDAGAAFTISTESPFSYSGEYHSRGHGNPLPTLTCDHHKVVLAVRDCSTLCFLSHIHFVPTDELHFIENYYSEEIYEEDLPESPIEEPVMT